jgi:hypothetical protein
MCFVKALASKKWGVPMNVDVQDREIDGIGRNGVK